MTELLPASPEPVCQADCRCDRVPCFEARLIAAAGRRCVHTHTELCAEHLGGTVQAIAAWARDQGLKGEVTVLAIDPPNTGQASPSRSRNGLAFGTIPLSS